MIDQDFEGSETGQRNQPNQPNSYHGSVPWRNVKPLPMTWAAQKPEHRTIPGVVD